MTEFNNSEIEWLKFFLETHILCFEAQLNANPKDEILKTTLKIARQLADKCGPGKQAGSEEWKTEKLPIIINTTRPN